jgi:hypothetical protein
MTSAIYVAILALLICGLSLNVIKLRRQNRVSLGDGGHDALKIAIAAQSNAVEYIPVTLLLLIMLEYNQASLLLVHFAGITFTLGRIIHARSLLASNLKGRVLGMQITLYLIIALAILNLFYLPYGLILKF